MEYLGVWVNPSLKDDDDIQRQVKSLYCATNKLRGTFDHCSPAVKTTLFRAYCMPVYAANCGANTRRPVWSAYVLGIAMPTELCITYTEMLAFAHTRLAIVSGPLMPCWELTCIEFLYDAHLHLTFLFDRFKCLMLFTNLHFSSIIQHSCMETKCSSCPWIVSEFASHQYCFCVAKTCGHCVHTKHKKVRSAGKVFCASHGWTRTNTGCVMSYCMVIHFLCFCEWRYSCGEDNVLCPSQC